MKIVLFVEGHTEQKAVPEFLKRWLDLRTTHRVGIQVVRYEGWPELIKDSPKKAMMYLRQDDVIAVIALLDLHGPTFYPPSKRSSSERFDWAKRDLESKVGDTKFFQFFAVHEVEAWLLSDPNIFARDIRSSFGNGIQRPEEVNFREPPSKLLNKIYELRTGRSYKKVTHGYQLFKKLDPSIAYSKCPYLKQLLDKMAEVANSL